MLTKFVDNFYQEQIVLSITINLKSAVGRQQLSALKLKAALGFGSGLDLDLVKVAGKGFGVVILESKLLELHVDNQLCNNLCGKNLKKDPGPFVDHSGHPSIMKDNFLRSD